MADNAPENMDIRTYEELIWNKIVKMTEAKEVGNEFLFDELLDEMEILFKLVPEIYEIFNGRKSQLDGLVRENMQEIKKITSGMQDEISKDILTGQRKAIIQWEYRSDVLDMIFQLLNEFQMIPFQNPVLGDMSSYLEEGEFASDDEYDEEEEEEIYVEEPEPVPQPPQQLQTQQYKQPQNQRQQNPKIKKPKPKKRVWKNPNE